MATPRPQYTIAQKRENVRVAAEHGNPMASEAMRVIEFYEDELRKIARAIRETGLSFDR